MKRLCWQTSWWKKSRAMKEALIWKRLGALTVTMDGRGAPVKCSITSQFDFFNGVWGVLGVFGECGCELGVPARELDSRSKSNVVAGFFPSTSSPPLVTCCLRLAHLLVLLLTAPVIDRGPSSPWKLQRKKKTKTKKKNYKKIKSAEIAIFLRDCHAQQYHLCKILQPLNRNIYLQ